MVKGKQMIHYLNSAGTLLEKVEIADELLLRGYRDMLVTRLVDERMITLQRQGTITFALSSYGEECCAVAAAHALDPSDWLYPQYRESGVMFARDCSIEEFVHSMFCNAKDLGKGRQMPNHFGARDKNIVQVSSPIATKIPHAAGCAYAMKLQKEPSIAMVFFGEGATSEGDFHTGVNFAAVRECPVIFFCRNNGYAISTPEREQYRSEGVAPKGEAYGIPAYKVDGNDFFAVYTTVAKARKECLENLTPILIEAVTYRMGAHSTSDDPSVYRTREDEGKWLEKDPVKRLKRYLVRQGLWNDKEEKALREEIEREISRAIETAKKTPLPPLETLIEDVYAEVPKTLREQLREVEE